MDLSYVTPLPKPVEYDGLIPLLLATKIYPVHRPVFPVFTPGPKKTKSFQGKKPRNMQDLASYDWVAFTSTKPGGMIYEESIDQIVEAAFGGVKDTFGAIVEAPNINVVRYLMGELKEGTHVNVVSGDGGITGFRPDLDLKISKFIQAGSQNFFTRSVFPNAVGENVSQGVYYFVKSIEEASFDVKQTPIFIVSTEQSRQKYISPLHGEGSVLSGFMNLYDQLHKVVKDTGARSPPLAAAATVGLTLARAIGEGLKGCFSRKDKRRGDNVDIYVDGKKIETGNEGMTVGVASTLERISFPFIDRLLTLEEGQDKGRVVIGSWPFLRIANYLIDLYFGKLPRNGLIFDGYAKEVKFRPCSADVRRVVLNGDQMPINEPETLTFARIPIYLPRIPEELMLQAV